jgi:hypothetical protein
MLKREEHPGHGKLKEKIYEYRKPTQSDTKLQKRLQETIRK